MWARVCSAGGLVSVVLVGAVGWHCAGGRPAPAPAAAIATGPPLPANPIEELRGAAAAASLMEPISATPTQEEFPADEVRVLRAIQLAADPRLVALRADARFQEAAESLLWETLRTGRGNVPINRAIFEIVSFLPDSERVSEILEMAFSLNASIVPLWQSRLYERLSPASVQRVRTRVRATPVGQVHPWALSLLALEGSDASQTMLETLLADARDAEGQPGPRTQRRGLVPELERLTALRHARENPLALARWGIEASGLFRATMGAWAFNEVARREGADSEVWRTLWAELEVCGHAEVGEYFQRGGFEPDADTQARLLAHWFAPWVEWADRAGVVVPDRIRSFTRAMPELPRLTSGC